MDPDVPIASIGEGKVQIVPPVSMSMINNPVATRRTSRSPYKDGIETSPSHPATPSPVRISRSSSRPTTPSHERPTQPTLQTRRSSSNLSANHGTAPQFRRTSSNLNPASPVASLKTSAERPIVTANTVAKDYFQKELEYHTQIESKVAVYVHDSCYGHRFSRPRTTKAALGTIVERPERIRATLLGVSTAYVRLGDRHSASSYERSPHRGSDSTSKPPFALRKTSRSVPLNHAAVTHVHGTKWMEELQIMCDSAEAKLATNGKELTRPIGYGKSEGGQPLPKLHEGDLYLCSESLAALQGCLGGVCDAADAVFGSSTTTRAFVCIRPPGHHCSSEFPSGFCWLNNVHVGISYAAMTHGLTHAAIFDFDLHHGDGSQTIAWNHNRDAQTLPKNAPAHKKTPIAYYSLHDINSYPCEWGDEVKVRNASLCLHNAHGQSIWNVHLESWTSLEGFWTLYESKYAILLQKARSFLQFQAERLRQTGVKPRGAIFISAGFDASQWEGAGMQRHNVNVPTEFYARFTEDVVKLSEEVGLGIDGRVISVLEGGYSDRALTSGVLSHLCGLVHEEEYATQSAVNTSPDDVRPSESKPAHDGSWWRETNLEFLEAVVNGNVPPPVKKKDKQPGNYSSPTHASNARMTEQARERRSLSTQVESLTYQDNAPVEPLPEVDWVTASYELSRLLIPCDRQTLSCRHDELNAEATRVRRERQSAIGLPTPDEEPMQLRTRKAKTTAVEGVRTSLRTTNRRTTIAAVSDLPDPSSVDTTRVRPRRRSSTASDILSSFQSMKIGGDDDTPSTNARIEQQTSATTTMRPPPMKTSNPLATRKTNSRVNTPAKVRTSSRSRAMPLSASRDLAGPQSDNSGDMSSPPLSHIGTHNATAEKSSGMDDLTKGMKKVSIKLKLPTPEQHAANQQKAEEEKQKKVRAPRKLPAPRLVRTKPPAASTLGTKSTHDFENDRSQSPPIALPTLSNAEPSTTVEQLPMSDGMLYTTFTKPVSPPSQYPVRIIPDAGIQNISLQKEDLATVQAQHIQNTGNAPTLVPSHSTTPPFQHDQGSLLTPSHSTDASTAAGIISPQRRTKVDLPVFSSTSTIPFSKQEVGDRREDLDIRTGDSTV